MQTTQNTAEQINSVVDHLAEKLRVPASQVWEILVTQGQIEAIKNVVFFVGSLAACIATLMLASRGWEKFGKDTTEYKVAYLKWRNDGRTDTPIPSDPMPFLAILFSVLGGVFTITTLLGFCGVISAIGWWMNPKYYALSQILEMVK